MHCEGKYFDGLRVTLRADRSKCLSTKPFDLNYGVPQGSCLGPLLFIIYVSKLFRILKHHLPSVHTYAEDTQLYLSFKPSDSSSEGPMVRLASTIMDKSVGTFDQNKRFLSASIANPFSPFSMLQNGPWTLSPGYNIEKKRGGRNVKIGD